MQQQHLHGKNWNDQKQLSRHGWVGGGDLSITHITRNICWVPPKPERVLANAAFQTENIWRQRPSHHYGFRLSHNHLFPQETKDPCWWAKVRVVKKPQPCGKEVGCDKTWRTKFILIWHRDIQHPAQHVFHLDRATVDALFERKNVMRLHSRNGNGMCVL